jgi:hypothetical protein
MSSARYAQSFKVSKVSMIEEKSADVVFKTPKLLKLQFSTISTRCGTFFTMPRMAGVSGRSMI